MSSTRLFIVCLIVFHISTAAAASADLYVRAFNLALDKLANDGLGVQAYQDYVNNELSFEETTTDGNKLVEQIALGLRDRLLTHTTMIHQLRDVIVESLQGSDVTISRCCNVTANDYDVRFRAQTNLGSMCSFGQTAQQRFNTTVLNKMRQNLLSVPTLRWQYFGTEENGLSFIYPATQNCQQDTFDARFRTWYSATISPSAKKVVVLMQQSASTRSKFCSGSAMNSIKDAASAIVTALNSEDKVAVLSFSNQVYVSPKASCYANQMSVVNPSTRADLLDFINYRTSDNYDANYTNAFVKAFALLNSSSSSSSSSNNNNNNETSLNDDDILNNSPTDSVIVLLTNADRIHVDINKTLDTIRDGNRPFRNKVVIIIYTFQDGDIPASTAGFLNNIAQQSRDDSTYEVSPGNSVFVSCSIDLRSQMTSYFTRFVNMDRNAPITYSVPYYDSLGVGLIMSLCAPVVIVRTSTLRGVTCVDVTIDTLFSEVQYFGQSLTSYAFLMDGYGRLLLHPLLPQPQTFTEDAPLADISAIEYDYEDNILDLRRGMLTNVTGQMTLKPRKVYRRGESELKGVSSTQETSTYYWHQVNGTVFTVCVVINAGDKDMAVQWSTAFPPAKLMDDDDLNNAEPRCNQFGRIAFKNLTTIKLAPSAFIQPSLYLDTPVNTSVVQTWRDYLEGKTSTSGYIKPGIREAVASTFKLQEIWQQRDTCTFAIWRYFGLKEGVFRKTPGTSMALNYDPTRRPWYQQAVADGATYSIYGPYVDASKTGCILSLAKPITVSSRSGTQEVLGVMAIDFTLNYFNGILLQSFPTCLQPKHECFVIDQSGFVVLHKGFIPPSDTCQYIFNQHITTLEPVVAATLIRLGILVTDNCISYVNINNLKFWKVDTSSTVINSSDLTVTIYTIPETNIYVIDKYNLNPSADLTISVPTSLTCMYPLSGDTSSVQSEYPCYYPTEFTERCTGQLSYNRAVPPCVPPAASVNMTDLRYVEAYYLSRWCNCNSSCAVDSKCAVTTGVTATSSLLSSGTSTNPLLFSATSSSSNWRLLALLVLLIPLIIIIVVVVLICRRGQNNNNNNNKQQPTGVSINPGYNTTEAIYNYISSSESGTYIAVGTTAFYNSQMNDSSRIQRSCSSGSEAVTEISLTHSNDMISVSEPRNSFDGQYFPALPPTPCSGGAAVRGCLDGPPVLEEFFEGPVSQV